MIHLVEERADGVLRAYQCIEHDHLTQIDAALMAAFLKKNPKSKGIIAAPISAAMSMNSVDFIPWEKAWAGVED